MNKYKVGDKVVYEVKEIIRDGVYLLSGWKESEPLSTYTEPLEAKIRRQAAEIARLLAENKELKAVNGNVIWEIEQAFDRGCNAAWELARKIFDMETNDIEDIFIEEDAWNLGTVLNKYTYPEAAEKVAEWEKAKGEICVGDVVRFKDNHRIEFCVTDILDDRFLYGVSAEGGVYADRNIKLFEKTGRHIDVDSFLKQIGEE